MRDEPDRLLTRSVRETLDSVVAPLVREALLRDALALSGAAELPRDAAGIREFAMGPLREVAGRALGTELAESLVDEIVRTLRHSRSAALWSEPPGVIQSTSRRPSSPGFRRSFTPAPPRRAPIGGLESRARSASTQPFHPISPVTAPAPRSNPHRMELPETPPPNSYVRTPPGPLDARTAARAISAHETSSCALVLVASHDAELVSLLTRSFSGRGEVRAATTPMGLIRLLDERGDRSVVLIIDGMVPSIRPAAVAVLLEEEPGVQVVFCRASLDAERAALSASNSAGRWIVYGVPTPVDRVAAECIRLVS